MANVSTATKAKATKNAVAKKKLGKDKEAKVKELLLEESQVIEAEVKELAVETKQSKQYLKNQREIAKKRQAALKKRYEESLKPVKEGKSHQDICAEAFQDLNDAVQDAMVSKNALSDAVSQNLKEKLEDAVEALKKMPLGAVKAGYFKQLTKLKKNCADLDTLWEMQSKNISEDQLSKRRDISNLRIDILDTKKKLKEAEKSGKVKDIMKHTKSLKGLEKELKEQGFLHQTKDEQGIVSLRKAARLALEMAGNAMKERITRLGDKVGSLPGKAYGSAVQSLLTRFENNPVMVKRISQVDKSLRFIGNAVKDTGTETLKWLGKQLKNLATSIWRFIRAPFSAASGFSLSDLAGLAMLATSVLGPLLSGIDQALEDRFGKHYIQDALSKAWDMAKTFVVEKVSAMLDEAWGTAKEVGIWIKKFIGKLFGHEEETPLERTPEMDESLKKSRSLWQQKDSKGNFVNLGKDQNGAMISALVDYDASVTQQARDKAKDRIYQLIASKPTVSPGVAKRLDDLGFSTVQVDVRDDSGKVTQGKSNTPAALAIANKVNPVIAARAANFSMPNATSYFVEGMGMDQSSISVPAPPTTTPPKGPETQGSNMTGTAGFTAKQIPNTAGPESLGILNLGVLQGP